MKTCTKCDVEKEETEFYHHKSGHAYTFCKPCHNERAVLWAKENPDRAAAIAQPR